MMKETLNVGDLEIEVRRSSRRKMLAVTVDRFGDLVVHVPTETSVAEISRWVTKRLLWVHRKLLLKQDVIRKTSAPEYVSGETFCYEDVVIG